MALEGEFIRGLCALICQYAVSKLGKIRFGRPDIHARHNTLGFLPAEVEALVQVAVSLWVSVLA
jgi:hypothetical protein